MANLLRYISPVSTLHLFHFAQSQRHINRPSVLMELANVKTSPSSTPSQPLLKYSEVFRPREAQHQPTQSTQSYSPMRRLSVIHPGEDELGTLGGWEFHLHAGHEEQRVCSRNVIGLEQSVSQARQLLDPPGHLSKDHKII